MSYSTDLILTGRPASRTTSRLYELHSQRDAFGDNSLPSTSRNVDSQLEDQRHDRQSITYYNKKTFEGHDSYASLQHRPSSYQTVPNASLVTRATPQQLQHKDACETYQNKRVHSPTIQSMSKTKNRYRPRMSKPSECDDMLFGKPMVSEYKEWKAPWDSSRTSTPLMFDSMDRAGHYSPSRQDAVSLRQSLSAKSQHRQPWK